jgi:hypothetical protein
LKILIVFANVMRAISMNGWNAQDEESSTVAQINSNLHTLHDGLLRYIVSIIVLYFSSSSQGGTKGERTSASEACSWFDR